MEHSKQTLCTEEEKKKNRPKKEIRPLSQTD